MHNVSYRIDRFLKTRTNIICSTFRTEDKIRGVIENVIVRGEKEQFDLLIKNLIKIRNESLRLNKISKKIDDLLK